jgi:hypothetical protein
MYIVDSVLVFVNASHCFLSTQIINDLLTRQATIFKDFLWTWLIMYCSNLECLSMLVIIFCQLKL